MCFGASCLVLVVQRGYGRQEEIWAGVLVWSVLVLVVQSYAGGRMKFGPAVHFPDQLSLLGNFPPLEGNFPKIQIISVEPT